MMSLLIPLAAFVLLVGNAAAWMSVYNRVHATGLPRALVQLLGLAALAALLLLSVLPVAWMITGRLPRLIADHRAAISLAVLWASVSLGMFVFVTASWFFRRRDVDPPHRLAANNTRLLDVTRLLGHVPSDDWLTRALARLPGNEVLQVHVQHKVLRATGLPRDLDGLRIAHLSDLHMTGRFTAAFLDLIVDEVNQWGVDLVAVTGDIVDAEACIDWVPRTLGRLSAPAGCFFVLGNHDRLLKDVRRLRAVLENAGFTDLGGRCITRSIRNSHVLLAGNERPWFPALPPVAQPADRSEQFAVALSHSPDQLPWARALRFDLMLAGHVHGGQIRLPVIGPVVCPSHFGVRFASGLFDAPPTLMHVTRGLSGCFPLRWNCPPEICLLELRTGER